MEEAQGTPALVPELPNSWHTDPTPGSPTGSLGVSWNISSQDTVKKLKRQRQCGKFGQPTHGLALPSWYQTLT